MQKSEKMQQKSAKKDETKNASVWRRRYIGTLRGANDGNCVCTLSATGGGEGHAVGSAWPPAVCSAAGLAFVAFLALASFAAARSASRSRSR